MIVESYDTTVHVPTSSTPCPHHGVLGKLTATRMKDNMLEFDEHEWF